MAKKKSKPATAGQAIELPTTEPTPIAEALDRSPAVATILASREAQPEPERPMPEPEAAVAAFKRQRERELAVADLPPPEPVPSHAARILAERPTYRQAPEEYFRVASHEREGIRVFKNTIIKGGQKIGVAAIQFAENRQPTRAEKDTMLDQGFRYKIEENLWKLEGRPGEALGDPTIAAVRTADVLAEGRKGLER